MEITDPRVDLSLIPAGSVARVVNSPDRDYRDYRDLPCIRTPYGQVITRWTLTDAERAAIVRGEDIYVTLLSGGRINPFYVTVGPVNWKDQPL
jgi:hypothetical protein